MRYFPGAAGRRQGARRSHGLSPASDGTRRLATEVRASLEFHHSQAVGADEIGRAVLTGVAASVPGFADALSAELAMPVQTRSVAATPELEASVDLGGMTVAAGLAVAEVPS